MDRDDEENTSLLNGSGGPPFLDKGVMFNEALSTPWTPEEMTISREGSKYTLIPNLEIPRNDYSEAPFARPPYLLSTQAQRTSGWQDHRSVDPLPEASWKMIPWR